MWNIKKFVCNQLQENCYVVSDETLECIIIDCGAFFEDEKAAIVNYIRQNNLTPCHLLATHGHFDHNLGNEMLFNEFQLKPEICAEDAYLVENLAEQTIKFLGTAIANSKQPPIGRLLKHHDAISFGRHTLTTLQTPGHSHGSALFYCQEENTVFTGDTLFRMSIGRTDFAEGSWKEMEQSLREVVACLPKETIVLAGHGPQSTMADELAYNPYLNNF